MKQIKDNKSQTRPPASCADMPSYKNSQDLINVQVDINRAVWASNQRNATEVSGSFQTTEDRDKYIEACIRSAYKTLGKLISG